ncbi:MFS transporter [Bartonella krasnovii]|uniref:YbfB/YjiJ family MFS transporter n=1 Tax=Bartonella krasnovii TaxID=2267275 RepID=UPI001F4CD1FB|nr:YbfB/YjiJ family MFS transporter [Bartonella krasnovii]UNF42811.1 MFS transporter [Bartonella krasnovii]UNF47635.1 MFS transporter [Bartonella krasnovii]UNF52604.1 MFS transporter [Bartonella krasnovii]UNF54310.1 MFS transporter [Bartonella krasnovii]UNF56021.1 MFS transporter [Bartonella krasnovii]
MRIERFLYTLILSVILCEELFTFNQLSYIVSANYGGYLVGNIFFTLGRIGNISCSSHAIWCSHGDESA